MQELKKGQQVVIKSAKLSGIVLGPRSAALQEDGLYKIQIAEQTLFCREENLTPWPEPDGKLQPGSADWFSEMARFIEVSKQYVASGHDPIFLAKISDSGAKLGFIIPIES